MPSVRSATPTQERRTPTLVSVDGRAYPLRSAQLRARAEGGIALSTLLQEFNNPHGEPLEVVYTMPLPADGAVLGYSIRIGEKVIRGEIQTREKAEKEYRKALYEGRTAGLLEQDRADTFLQRLGNVPPKTAVTVEIEVLHPLAFLAGVGAETGAGADAPHAGPVWEYRFPTVVSARYEGAPGRVEDAGRLDADRDKDGGIPTRIGLHVTIADSIEPGSSVRSTSHDVETIAGADGTIARLASGARLDRDLVLRWPAAAGEVGVRVAEGRGLAGDDGRYALLTVTPPRIATTAYHRDVTVLIDTSGSMDGPPIDSAKRVVVDLLKSLESGDQFELIEFGDKPHRLTKGLVAATAEEIEKGIATVWAIQCGGSTEMKDAIEAALQSLRADSQRQVVLVSDGYIGFEAEIISTLRQGLPEGVRVHAVGIGSAPNRSLTSGVARAGRGVELCAGDDASAADAARRLCLATSRPVLTDLQFGGSAVKAVAPARPRDVFAGQPLVAAVELNPAGGSIEVRGRLAGSCEVWIWRMEVGPEADPVTPLPIGALYGREAIADAEMESWSDAMGDPEFERVDSAIEALGLRHRITSRRTSLVAIADEPSVDPNAPRRRERLAVELPAGVSAEGVGLLGHPLALLSAMRFRGQAAMPLSASFTQRLVSLVKGPAQPGAPQEALLIDLGVGDIVLRDGPEIVLEFQTSQGNFYLPVGQVEIRSTDDRILGKARLIPRRSSARGPHAAGLVLRITLRIRSGGKWPTDGPFELRWDAPAEMTKGSSRGIRFRLTVPPAESA